MTGLEKRRKKKALINNVGVSLLAGALAGLLGSFVFEHWVPAMLSAVLAFVFCLHPNIWRCYG